MISKYNNEYDKHGFLFILWQMYTYKRSRAVKLRNIFGSKALIRLLLRYLKHKIFKRLASSHVSCSEKNPQHEVKKVSSARTKLKKCG